MLVLVLGLGLGLGLGLRLGLGLGLRAEQDELTEARVERQLGEQLTWRDTRGDN